MMREENPIMIDPRLEEMLKVIQRTPERDPAAEAQGLNRFCSEIDDMADPLAGENFLFKTSVYRFLKQPKENFNLWIRKPIISGVFAILLILIFLFGGTGITAFAAQSSLPGDILYSFKTRVEVTQANLESDPGARAQLYMFYASRRLDEIAALIEEGRFEDITQASDEFDRYIQKALNSLDALSQVDPQRAIALNADVSQMISRFAHILLGMLSQVPEPVKANIQKAIDSTQIGITNQNVNDGSINGDFRNDVNNNVDNVNNDDEIGSEADDRDEHEDDNLSVDNGDDVEDDDCREEGGDCNDEDDNGNYDDDNGTDDDDNGNDDGDGSDNGDDGNDDDDEDKKVED